MNTEGQGDWTSVMYTPAYGSSFTMKVDGKVFLAEGGKLKSFTSYEAGAEVSIPQNGFAVFMGKEYYSTDYFRTPVIGTELTTQPYLRITDEEGFTLQNIESIVSGAPRLVKDGKIVTELEEGWTEARFTTACTPRTAAGITGEGRLLLVNAAAATIQQLREVMLSLGCVDAINLDGGGSTGMYYNGEYLSTPGRELTPTLQIFLEK